MGTEVADTEAAEIKDTAAPEPTAETIEREAEETVEEGSAAVEDEESSASAEDEISEDDEEEKEEEEDPERLSELEILPGKTAYINFYYTIDPEIEGMKDQKVDFSFAYTLEDEEGKQTKNTLRETFRYAVDALNLMTVTAGGEKGYVETGKEDEMLLEFDLGLMREVLEEAIEEELEKTENGDASAAEAKRASASELLVGWEDENGERPLGKKDPAVIKNLKCEVETFGVKLDKFKAIPVKDDDNFGTSLKCSFYVSRKTLPGTYYGRVNASYKIKGKSFHTTQGFKVVVKQETGEMELVGKIGDSEIIMTGPVSSFPKADELSLKVSEITQEQQEKVDEALQKKAEEEGTEISQYKALDIKLMADGVETEPEGDVQVRFKNVNLEKVDEKKEAEQEKAEEQSIVKKAVRKVMSLFSDGNEEEDAAAVAETETEVETESKDSEDGKAEGSEEAAGEAGEAAETAENSENIKVLHLDEDAVVANEMKSEVQENGDVVMDTDHFSIYVVVDMGRPGGYINVTVEHWASVRTITAVDNDGIDMNLEDIGEGTNPSNIIDDKTTFNEVEINGIKYAVPTSTGEIIIDGEKYIVTSDTKEISINNKNYPVKFSTKIFSYNQYMYDQVYNRYSQTINTKLYPLQEIYKPSEDIVIQNEKQIDKIESLSKLSTKIDGTVKNAQEKGYKIKEIWVTNDKTNLGEKDWKNGTYTKYIVNTWDEDENVNEISGGQVDIIQTEDGKKTAITLKEDSLIRFIYEELKSEIAYFPVTFYDHNLLDYGYKDADLSTCSYKIVTHGPREHTSNEGEGLNRPSFFKYQNDTRAKIGVGQYDSGNTTNWNANTWSDSNFKLNAGNKKPINESTKTLAHSILGIVTEKLDNGNLQFAEGINYPRFFQESTYTDENEETYFANKEIKDYKLGFKKEGDTYYLTSVKKPAGKTDLQNLDKIRYSQWSKWSSAALFSNEFWPLDDVKPYRGMDHYEGQGSDDGKIHNWHFGMVFEFDFTVDDYKGPMNFYFRGDDDFWMFIDGIKAIDIGGIHSAGGEAIDINEFFAKQKIKAEGTHHVKIYFMERGGTGSCCYLQFTLPNCKPVSFPGVDTANLEVEKHWDDFNDPLRPEKITIQLYRKEIDEAGNPVIKDEDKKLNANGKPIIENGMPVIKDEVKDKYDDDWFRLIDEDDKIKPEQELGGYENIWKCRWEELPKVNPNSKNKYIYKVKEKNVDGYKSTYSYVITPSKDLNVDSNSDNTQNDVKIEGDAAQDYEIKFGEGKDEINGNITCIITNTLSPKVTVEVEKKWRDDNQLSTIQNRPSVTLQLQYKKEGENEFINFPGDKGVLTLDGTVDVNIDSETGKKIKSAWEDRAWHGRFEDLPTFANKDENGKSTRVPIVAYRVREYKQGTNDELLENDYSAFSSEYTVTYNDTEPTKIEQANPSNDPGDVVAKTEITNAVATNCSVRKEWKDVPSTVNATAKIGLCWRISGTDDWKLVNHYMKEETNTSDKSKSIIWLAQGREEDKKKFFFTFESNSEIQIGKWKNLPKYNESGQEIQYKIFELDGSDSLITIPENGEVIVTIDNQKYKVTSTTEDAGNDTPGFDDESDSGSSNSEDDIPETNGESTSSSGIQDVVVITNQYMAQLQVTKRIDVKEEELVKYSDKEFKFVVKIKNKENNQVIKLPDPGNSEKYTVEESGDVTFTLTPTETITIPVPIGSIVTITEDTKGYSVQYTGVDGGSSNGNTATITITTNSSKTIEVTCTNKPGVVLPDTGGPGLLMMSRLGWMLLLLALLMAGMEIQFYGERRNRKTANVQREDTRGFDPDDY